MRRLRAPSARAIRPSSCSAPQQRLFIFGGSKNNNASAAASSQDEKAPPAGGMPSMSQMLNTKRVQEFMKAPPEKQLETMKAALEMQKKMSKVPGIGFLAGKNAEMMEKLIRMQESSVKGKSTPPEEQRKLEEEVRGFMAQQQQSGMPPPPPPLSSASTHSTMSFTSSGNVKNTSSSSSSTTGPTLDDLKKVNLGAEIEALFAELKLIRDSKNQYRDKFNAREKELEDLSKETQKLRESEESMRKKLQLAEKNVLLLNSENMELQEKAKQAKDLRSTNEKLTQQVSRLQSNDTVPLLKRIEALEHDTQAKSEAIRALTRKLDRTRRRDPLLQFSQACSSDILRLLGDEHQPSVAVEEAFTALQDAFEGAKQQSWEAILADDTTARAAKLLVASCQQVLAAVLSTHAALDAVVVVTGDLEAAKEFFSKQLGFTWTPDAHSAGRVTIASPPNSPPISSTASALGPFGVAVALRLAAASYPCPFRLSYAQAHVSKDLATNPNRAQITYEACRSGGPGGQAANVSETQLTAKLSIDGHFLFQAEAQDSRSAVANKEAATERLLTVRRQQWNENAPKPTVETLRDELKTKYGQGVASRSSLATSEGSSGDPANLPSTMDEHAELVLRATTAGSLSFADCAVVHAVALLR